MDHGLRRSLDDIEAHAKAHPAAAAGVGMFLVASAALLGRKHAKPAATAQNGAGTTQATTGTIYTNPGAESPYVPPSGAGYPSSGVYTQIMGPPGPAGPAGPAGATGAMGPAGARGATGATGPADVPHVPPTPKPTPSPAPKPSPSPKPWSPPASVTAKYRCPPGYSFAPEHGNTGNVVCHPNSGKGSDIQVVKK